jgi:hypothetical protein
MANRVNENWEMFARLCVSKDAPPVQLQDMRRAFYAGTWAVIMDMGKNAGGALFEEVKKECEEFLHKVNAGEA